MPTAPTPGPPQVSCSWRARARSQTVIGEVRPTAHVVNSRETQDQAARLADVRDEARSPGTPKRLGRTAVQPRSTTRSVVRTHRRDPLGRYEAVGEHRDHVDVTEPFPILLDLSLKALGL